MTPLMLCHEPLCSDQGLVCCALPKLRGLGSRLCELYLTVWPHTHTPRVRTPTPTRTLFLYCTQGVKGGLNPLKLRRRPSMPDPEAGDGALGGESDCRYVNLRMRAFALLCD